MCEGVGEDSRHKGWHVDIHVERYLFLLECVWMCEHGIACALRWGVALIEEFICWALLTVTPQNPGVPLTTINLRKTCVSHIMRPIHE